MFPGKNVKADASMTESSAFEKGMANTLTNVITGKMKIIPIGMIVALVAWSTVQTQVLSPN